MANKKGKASPRDQEFGWQLRVARKAAGMSQEELGRRVGLTFQQIQKYELGINRISISRLEQFAEVLGFTMTWFFDEKVQETITAFSDEDMNVIKFYKQVPEKLKPAALSNIKQLAKAA